MLSVIVPYRHSQKMALRFKYFLQSVEEQKRDVEFEVILVEYIEKYPYMLPSFVRVAKAAPIKFIDNKPVFFHQSYINNVGALKSKGDMILFTNADIIFEPGAFKYAVDELNNGHKFVSLFTWYSSEKVWKMIEERHLDVVKDFDTILRLSNVNDEQAPRAAFQALKKDDFINKLGGYDPDMWGWGAEEYEFYQRAKQILEVVHTKRYKCIHLWHKPNWGNHHPKRGGIHGENMTSVSHKTGIWRDPITGNWK